MAKASSASTRCWPTPQSPCSPTAAKASHTARKVESPDHAAATQSSAQTEKLKSSRRKQGLSCIQETSSESRLQAEADSAHHNQLSPIGHPQMKNAPMEPQALSAQPRVFSWWREAPRSAKKALLAASLGWMLDSFDVMLYSLVLASLMADLHLSKGTAGILGSVTLLAAAVGGLSFGIIADRFGRTRALMASVLIYAIFTAACGLAHNFIQLAVFRILLGLGMGGEWASGASLVSETGPPNIAAKPWASCKAPGQSDTHLAALVVAVVMPLAGWRAVFFVGVLPAFFTLWVRRSVEEPEVWKSTHTTFSSTFGGFAELFRGPLLRPTIVLTLMNACCLFAWWGFNLWVPAYLSLPTAQGGIGLTSTAMSVVVIVMQIGMWFGYITFGFVSDAVGRKKTYITYLLTASILLFTFGMTRTADSLTHPRPPRRLLRNRILHWLRGGNSRNLRHESSRNRTGASPTTPAESSAPPLHSPSAHSRKHTALEQPSPSAHSRSCSPHSSGSGFPKQKTEDWQQKTQEKIKTSYSGIFPCFLAGFFSRFVANISSAEFNRLRVSLGRMTASIYPRSAAT